MIDPIQENPVVGHFGNRAMFYILHSLKDALISTQSQRAPTGVSSDLKPLQIKNGKVDRTRSRSSNLNVQQLWP